MGSAIEIASGDIITVRVIPAVDFAPIYIAEEEGYFTDEGLHVETKVMQSAAAIAPSVINGQLQFGTAALPPLIGAYEKGLPLQIVANTASTAETAEADHSGLVVRPGSAVTRPRDLEGTTVGINALNSVVHVAAVEAIRSDGGDPAAVDFVAMPLPDVITALARGQIEAASLAEPFRLQATAVDGTVIDHPYLKAFGPGAAYAVAFTAGPFAEANPNVVASFRRAVDKASELAAESPAKVRRVLVEKGKVPQDVAEAIRLPTFTTTVEPATVQKSADLMTQLGFLPASVDTAGLIRP